MGLSLQDQLLQAGLVSKGKANKANKEKKKKAYQQRDVKRPATSPAEKKLQEERAARSAKDRELNSKLNEAIGQREMAAQVKQLVENNRHPRSAHEDDVAFCFDNKGKVKKIHVSKQDQRMITSGMLCIVNYNGAFELVPSNIAQKIKQRNPALVIELPKEQETGQGDPYEEFQIPDDLQW